MMKTTPDLSTKFLPQPKPMKKGKKPPKPLRQTGPRTEAWMDALPKLQALFKENGISSCEIRFEGCKGRMFYGFAHVEKRGRYDLEGLVDPHHVVWACSWCHEIVDNAAKMPKDDARELLEKIVEERGW
jgi:hypothetical protein